MKQAQLLPLIREEVQRCLNGYVRAQALLSDIESYIVTPALGDNAGLCGALALGLGAANRAARRG